MARPAVRIHNETKRLIVRVSEALVYTLPPFPGGGGLPPGPINDTLVFIGDSKANRADVPSISETNALKEGQEALRQTIDGLDGQVGGLATDLGLSNEQLAALESTVANLNLAQITSLSINAQQHLILTLSDGTTIDGGVFPYLPGYRGTATAAPTGAGTLGDWYRNTNPSLDLFAWVCVTTGSGAGVWRARGGKVYEDMPFEFTTNDTYDYPVATARTISAPLTWGATATIVWSYSTNGTTFNAATFPLSMAVQSILRATVTGLAAGTKRYAAAARTG